VGYFFCLVFFYYNKKKNNKKKEARTFISAEHFCCSCLRLFCPLLAKQGVAVASQESQVVLSFR
jgi:hypothetical protein